jgi:hypothetical protein
VNSFIFYKDGLDDNQNLARWIYNYLINHRDKTLLRNLLAIKISTLFEMPFTPEYRPVDIIMN